MNTFADENIEVDPQRAQELIAADEVQLVDVREPHEVAAGRLSGSRHIEIERLASQAETLARDKPVLFYCRLGSRSGMAAHAFRRAGYEAFSLTGGLTAWHERGLPLEPEDGYVADHWAAAAAAVLALALGAPSASAAPGLVKVAELSAPIAAAAPPGDERLFVAEQAGVVRVLGANGALLPEPFLDVTQEVLAGGERGLLGLAFAADYAATGRVFVYLTAKRGALGAAADGEVQIRRYTVSPGDPNRADPASGVVLLRQSHSDFSNHNGGALRVGPDGMVWAGIGDGGGGNNTVKVGGVASAQSLATLLGKIVRITPSGEPAPGNPFLGVDGARPEIWALGLRNPFRFSFDRLTGDLIIGDVGQDAREEIDFAPAADGLGRGANWGWPCFEGSRANVACRADGARPPVFELNHSATGAISIIGGVVVRDAGLPSLAGRYLYTDLAFDTPRSLVLSATGAADDRPEGGLAASTVVSFDEDGCGRVVLTSLAGPILRVVDGAPAACGTAPPSAPGPAPAPAAQPGCAATVRLAGKVRLRALRRTGLKVRVRSLVPCRVSGRAGAGARRAVTLVPGARRTLRLKPSRAQRRALGRAVRRKGAARLTVRLRLARDGSGAAFRRVVHVLVVP